MCYRPPADRFGFSWRVAYSPRKPRLSTIGFPWISLESLVRIETYQWVTRDKSAQNFRGPFLCCFGATGRHGITLGARRINCRFKPIPFGWLDPRSRARDYRRVNPVDFTRAPAWNHFAPSGLHGRLPSWRNEWPKLVQQVPIPASTGCPSRISKPLTLLRRLVVEIEDSIAQSRAVILSTRDAIELLERLEGRQFSN